MNAFRRKRHAILQLLRIANAPTAVADVVAGAVFMGATSLHAAAVAWLCLASLCLYSGGMVLNDVCDFHKDQLARRERPLPAGEITRTAAGWLAIALLSAGAGIAWMVGGRSAQIGLGLFVAIVTYDAILKETPLAPGVMGLCRALNLALGMSVTGPLGEPQAIYVLLLHWAYITSVTAFARKESGGGSALRLKFAAAGACTAVFALAGLPIFVEPVNVWYLLLVGVFLGRIASSAYAACTTLHPRQIQAAVAAMITSIVLFDACLVFATRGPLPAAAILLLLAPVIFLSGKFRMT